MRTTPFVRPPGNCSPRVVRDRRNCSNFSLWSSADIKEHVKQLEKAVSGKEPRFVLRALRMLPSTSRRLNHYVLYKAVHGFFTSNNATRDFLLPFLEEVSGLALRVLGRIRSGLGCGRFVLKLSFL